MDEREYIVSRIAVREEVEENLLGFFADVEDFVDNWNEAQTDRVKKPWGDEDPRLWALGFYFDPERQGEPDEWDLMEGTESNIIDLVRFFEELDLTKDTLQPDRSIERTITDLPAVWEGLKTVCSRMAEQEST